MNEWAICAKPTIFLHHRFHQSPDLGGGARRRTVLFAGLHMELVLVQFALERYRSWLQERFLPGISHRFTLSCFVIAREQNNELRWCTLLSKFAVNSRQSI
ncbi:hypothetical protein Droror1_Dr00021245 [Drosera rotundifolia]